MAICALLAKETPLRTGSLATYPNHPDLKKAFTYVTRFGDVVNMWEERGDHLLVPRAACPVGLIDDRVQGVPEDITSLFKPRNAEQVRVVSESLSLLGQGESFVMQATTGFGKTPISCHLIAQVGRRTFISVHKGDMVKTWREHLLKFTTLKENEIGLVQGDIVRVAGCAVVIGMLQSISKKGRYPKHLWEQFGFLVIDEVHRVPTEHFTEVLRLFPGLLRMGLSATPERADGQERTITAHIGPVRVITHAQLFKPRVFTYASPWRCPMTFTINEKTGQKVWRKMPHKAGKCGHVVSHLIIHDRRNHLIARILQTAYSRGRKIILMSDRTKHLRLLRSLIIRYGVKPVDIRYYWGGLTDEEIDVAQTKPVLLATYQYASESTDIPGLDCIILATPRAEVKQALGRILREHPMKPIPIVFDITDNSSPVFKGYRLKRSSLYRKIGATLEMSN